MAKPAPITIPPTNFSQSYHHRGSDRMFANYSMSTPASATLAVHPIPNTPLSPLTGDAPLPPATGDYFASRRSISDASTSYASPPSYDKMSSPDNRSSPVTPVSPDYDLYSPLHSTTETDNIVIPQLVPPSVQWPNNSFDDWDSLPELLRQDRKADYTPRRPMNIYFIYMRVRRPELALHNPNLSTGDLSKLLGKEWNSMTPDQKAPWNELAERLMRAFKKKFPDYQYERGGTKKLLKKQRARSAPNALALITSPRSMAETAYRVHGMHPYHHARVGYQLQQPLSPHDAYYQQQHWEAQQQQQHSYGASYNPRGGLVSPTAFPVYGVSPLQQHQPLQQQQLAPPATTPPPSYASAPRLQQQQQHYHLASDPSPAAGASAGAPAPPATSTGAYSDPATMAAAASAGLTPLRSSADQPGNPHASYFPAQYAVAAPQAPDSAAAPQGSYAVPQATYAHYMPPLYAAAAPPTAPPVVPAPSPWEEYIVQ
ncbi:hypothetical protein Q8F55_005504 [Vanrija albida]|uniref:HMG box domain-containing protein n=1 Tax=Vanrija albida TaxID=181172 RepID=A0ABR3Q2K7_9TREE